MDERQFQAVFKQTLEAEIPNVELWKQIESHLPAPSNPTVKTGLRLGKVALIAALLVMAVAAYAFYQRVVVPGDPGIESQADLLTYIDETTTLPGENELSVTLDYAYADANRVTVSYTVRGVSPDGRRMMAYSNPTLMLDGQPLDRLMRLAQQEAQAEPTETEPRTFSHTLTTNYIAPANAASETLDLQLMVEVALSDLDSGEFPAPAMMMAGMARFEFSVPFFAGTVIEIDQTADAAQPSVELQRASITPSMTRLDLCYTLPPVTEPPGWSPFLVLTIDGETMFAGQVETYGLDDHYDLNSPCRAAIIPLPLRERAGEWQVEIQAFNDLGSFSEPVTGGWTFTFTVPEN